jgi:hypothetical protein
MSKSWSVGKDSFKSCSKRKMAFIENLKFSGITSVILGGEIK